MSLPTRRILVHVDDDHSAARRLLVARELARPLDADVLACYAATSTARLHRMAVGLAMRGIDDCEERDSRRRDSAYDVFSETCGDGSHISWLDLAGDPGESFVRQALYADYLVMQQYLEGKCGVPPGFVERVMVETGKPTLVMPHSGVIRPVPHSIAIAWNGTREAARAVSSAMPLLRNAMHIHIIGYGDDARNSVSALASRFNVQRLDLNLHTIEDNGGGIGRPLLERAADVGADMLVMGCYGHGPVRESVLGGVTRTVLAQMTLPVWMTH